jgi:hypothetical protein
VVTAEIDTGDRTDRGVLPDGVELVVAIPALTTTIVPDTRTVTLVAEAASDVAFTTPVTLGSKVLTGAGGAGTDAAELRVSLPVDVDRYVRGKYTFGASTTTGAAVTAETSLIPDMGK